MTQNSYGEGSATYLGCWTSDAMLREIMGKVLKDAGVWCQEQEVEFPVIIKKGINDYGKEVVYFLNYSPEVQELACRGNEAGELLTGRKVGEGDKLALEPWGLQILERCP